MDEDKVKVTGVKRVANVTKVGGELAIHSSAVGDKVGDYVNNLTLTIMQQKQLESEYVTTPLHPPPPPPPPPPNRGKFTTELEINDYPQKARWLVTNREKIDGIITNHSLEVSVMTKGVYSASGRTQGEERKLYIQIDGKSKQDVDNAKRVFKEVLEEAMQSALAAASSLGVGKAIKPR